MRYRMISASALPLALSVAGSAVALRKPGDSVEVELSAQAAERIARHGAVRFEALIEPPPEPVHEPAEEARATEHAEPLAFAHADLTTTETPLEPEAATR